MISQFFANSGAFIEMFIDAHCSFIKAAICHLLSCVKILYAEIR